ncbi:MAG TPA: right-handed parallel beta-helix repeat-containing protein, partial [Planctomycetaceae bacterium]|nr:right-handed parallel beta-helix repeat-containing protein [Planctomycetaceae bacterium]
FNIQNNTITQTRGDAIFVDQRGTDVAFDATNTLTRSFIQDNTIQDNTIGTFGASTLASAVDDADTEITVADPTQFPSTPGFSIRIDGEQMQVTAIAGSTFTVTRGAGGTTAAPHEAGSAVVQTTGGQTAGGRGIAVNLEERSAIQDLHILRNVIANNAGNGIDLTRSDNAAVLSVQPLPDQNRAVTISENVIDNNQVGIRVLTQNSSADLIDLEARNNRIANNRDDGVALRAEADSRILFDMEANVIQFNAGDGVQTSSHANFPAGSDFSSDKRQVVGTWIKNVISDNNGNGVNIVGLHGLTDDVTGVTVPLVIGMEGTDPVDGLSRGNRIERNASDGIRVARADGHGDNRDAIAIANNT